MEHQEIQQQINDLNSKIDKVLEYVALQHQKREEWDDLIADLSIVGKDAFNQTVQTLDNAGVELDSCGFQCLMIKILRNLDTLNEMVELVESTKDFFRDATPIFRQIGLDTINKMNELEEQGVIEKLTSISQNLTNRDTLATLEQISGALARTRMDDELDNQSLWRILKELRSKEVRKTISFMIRLLKNMQ
jgi:uncharacterized protein YjgD (DUF1641 family)